MCVSLLHQQTTPLHRGGHLTPSTHPCCPAPPRVLLQPLHRPQPTPSCNAKPQRNLSAKVHSTTGSGGESAPMPPTTSPPRSKPTTSVLLYVPNLIGYLRLLLLLFGWALHQQLLGVLLVVISIVLDSVDGILARALNQASEFGAFLDVWTDNLTRGILWSLSGLPAGLGVLPVMLEMSVFVATHKGGGAAWKDGCFRSAPTWVQWMMASGFKTPQGMMIVGGLFGLPLWLWLHRTWPWDLMSVVVLCVLCVGRLMALSVELWVMQRHLAALINQDDRK